MVVTAGQLVFIKLDHFKPPWRQAVVLSEKGRFFALAVRVTSGETNEEAARLFSHYECEGCHFMLVQGQQSQMREQCSHAMRGLEVAAGSVKAAGLVALQQDDLNYATASEDISAGAQASAGITPQALVEDSSEEDPDEEDGSADEIMQLLRKAKKAAPGGATSSEKPKSGNLKKSSRYALLTAGKSNEKLASSNGIETLLQQSINSVQPELASQSLNAMVSMELLKVLRGKSGKKSSSSVLAPDDEQEDSDASSLDSSSSTGKRGGASRAMKEYRRGHKAMRKNPMKHVRRYIKEVEYHLGASAETAYNLSDFTRKLNWGNQRTLLRVHFALSEILQTLLKNQPEQAALELVQLLRAVHQTNLDRGSWRASWLLLRYADPIETPKFGGEPQDLERVAGYLNALQKLEKRAKGLGKGDQEEGGGKGKKGKQNPKKQAEETAM